MKRWQCAALCFALGPIATVVSAWLLSGPILYLYETGQLGANPTWPLIHIVCGGLTMGVIVSAALWGLLQTTLPERERLHLHIWRREA